MSVKNGNFIFRQAHRRITYMATAAILPLFATAAAALLVQITNLGLASKYLEYSLQLPAWLQAIAWLILPITAVILSRQGYKRGTVYKLRSWNTFIYYLGLMLLAAEGMIVLASVVF